MPAPRVVMVIDMQNGVLAFPRHAREQTAARQRSL